MRTASQRRHDVVIVGARVAGAATAMLLARLGHDVVVVAPAETLRELVGQSRARSAVHDIITNRVPVTIEVEHPLAARKPETSISPEGARS
jgi:glycine/D-amino acid oxidase-like deaminating enzyme